MAKHSVFIKKMCSWNTLCPYFSSRPSSDHLYVHFTLISTFIFLAPPQSQSQGDLIACCTSLSHSSSLAARSSSLLTRNEQTRQLNLWGFNRRQDIDAWAHPNFIRGRIERLEFIQRMDQKKRARRREVVGRRRSITTRNATTFSSSSPLPSDAGFSSDDSTSFSSEENAATLQSTSPFVDNDDEVKRALFTTTTTTTATTTLYDNEEYEEADGSRMNNNQMSNADNNSSTNNSSTFTARYLFHPPTWWYNDRMIHNVQPSAHHPTNAAMYPERDDNFMFQLSQILDIETRPPYIDDLESILSLNEASDDAIVLS